MSLIADELDEFDQIAAYKELKSARRKNRIAQLDWFDAFYKAYLTAIVSAIGIYYAVNQIGDRMLSDHHVDVVNTKGPAYLGLAFAFAFAIGFRSGGRGGPLAFEQAEVRHVLLSPLDKRFSIRYPAKRQLLHVLFVAVVSGGVVGFIAAQRFPQNPLEWIGSGALAIGAAICGAYGTAMITGGLRIKRWLTDVLALAVVLWSVLDVTLTISTSPLTWLGDVAVWAIEFRLIGIAGVAVCLVVAIVGLSFVNRLSLEAAERRSKLVGQLRFAATLQDVRTVMVLQRQLAQEHIRTKPWFKVRYSNKDQVRNGRVRGTVFVKRSLAGIARWPGVRIGRVVVLVALATASLVGVWAGTTVLVIPAGIALWIAALDLTESLAQEVDHPDRLSSVAQKRGVVYLRHLLMPFLIMYALAILAMSIVLLVTENSIVTNLFPVGMIASLAAIGGAATAITQKPALPSGVMETPEIASAKFVVRVVYPPALAILGVLPVAFAQRAWSIHHTVEAMAQGMNTVLLLSMIVAGWSIAWVRYRDELLDTTSVKVQGALADKPKEEDEPEPKPAKPRRTQAVGNVKAPQSKKKKGKK